MKMSKKLFSALMALVMIAAAFSTFLIAEAASTKTLKTDGVAVKVTANGYYKISVTEEGCLTLTLKVSGSDTRSYGRAYAYLLNSKKKEFAYDANYLNASVYGKESETVTKKAAVSKGTYYIKIENLDRENGASVTLKAAFTSVKAPTNYCPGKATALKASKKTTIYQTQNYACARWYKITLDTNRKIKLYVTGSSYRNIYDAEGNEVDLKAVNYSGETSIYETPKLAKGTYYFSIDNSTRIAKTYVTTFYWK